MYGGGGFQFPICSSETKENSEHKSHSINSLSFYVEYFVNYCHLKWTLLRYSYRMDIGPYIVKSFVVVFLSHNKHGKWNFSLDFHFNANNGLNIHIQGMDFQVVNALNVIQSRK